GLASLAGNFLGMKTSGALFVDLVHSRTVQDHVVDRLNLQKVYWARYKQDARKVLDSRTEVNEDRKSGVISIGVTDRKPQRAREGHGGGRRRLAGAVDRCTIRTARLGADLYP